MNYFGYIILTSADPFLQGDWYTTCGMNLFFPFESVSRSRSKNLKLRHNFENRLPGVMLGTTAAPLACNLSPSRPLRDTLASRNLPRVSISFYSKLCHSLSELLITGYPVVNIEHWTSGTDRGYDANHVWCSTKAFLNMKEVNWKSGQPNTADGHCTFVQFSDKSANQTFVATGDCSQKRKFICQVNMPLSKYSQFFFFLSVK